MRFDKQKAFPYPVLRPDSDDYIDAEFQTTVELTVGEEYIKASISYALSSEEIAEEIKKGNAAYISIVSCRQTYFLQAWPSRESTKEAKLHIGQLRGEVKIDPYIVVRKKIEAFRSADINTEFGSGPFNFSGGDVLAQDEPQIFYIDRDLFKPVTSVFDLVKKDDLSNGEWNIGFDEDHIQIEVSPDMKESLDDARNSNENRVILLNSIYFAAVMQAVQKLKESRADYEGRKWAEVITRQAHNHGCDLESLDAYMIAQYLMKLPLSLLHTYIFKG